MKLTLSLVSIAVSIFSTLASAQFASNVVTIEGKQAQQIVDGMSGSSNTKWLENSVGVTVLENGNVKCTLIGSHGGSARFKNPIYSCDLSL